MTAFNDLSELINRFTGGNSGSPQHIFFWKDARVGGAAATTPIAGRWHSMWEYEGSPSHGVAATSTGAALDNTTQGGLKQTDPSGGRQLWCSGAALAPSQNCSLLIYDRLCHDGGLDGTNTGAQTISFTPPSRYSGAAAAGNMMFLEINTLIGATVRTVTASYTNQAGTAAHTTQAVSIGGTGLREAQRMIPLTLQAGDTGVRDVASVTLSATTGTVGAFGMVIARPLILIPGGVGSGGLRDLVAGVPSLVEILTDACLAMAFFPQSTNAHQMLGSIHMAER